MGEEDIRKILSNNNHPFSLRIVKDHPFEKQILTSYGLIIKAKNTGRYLVIQKSRTIEFMFIIRGIFKYSHLPYYISKLTSTEILYIRTIIESEEFYNKIAEDFGFRERRWKKLQFLKFFNSHFDANNPNESDEVKLKWEWPKGMMKKNETEQNCAFREFYEETGIKLHLEDVKIGRAHV